MAEALLKHLYGEKYEVFSAGSNPTQVNPFAIKVMAEIGVDISSARARYFAVGNKKRRRMKYQFLVAPSSFLTRQKSLSSLLQKSRLRR
jgi:hypothetical protein